MTDKGEGRREDYVPYWRPRFMFDNIIEIHEKMDMLNERGYLYDVTWTCDNQMYIMKKWFYDCTFSERFELENFPLDVQDISIIIQNVESNNKSCFMSLPNFQTYEKIGNQIREKGTQVLEEPTIYGRLNKLAQKRGQREAAAGPPLEAVLEAGARKFRI
eukprot:TRINITY_DN3514_c0_g1_i1.p1 TRINITY_DN3514_c0_g1~~TRINITY_DN3514_c0_g1_i1.p1  ORF type:complete len:160 (+),score=24.79 TRINITY_DN3514_c0_g1_i1:307-786(+)